MEVDAASDERGGVRREVGGADPGDPLLAARRSRRARYEGRVAMVRELANRFFGRWGSDRPLRWPVAVTAVLGVRVHSWIPSLVRVGPRRLPGPRRAAMRKAELIVDSISRSGRPACCAA